MKKVLIFLFLSLIISCNNDDESINYSELIEGEWVLNTINDTPTLGREVWNFIEDGTFTITTSYFNTNGNWNLVNNNLKIKGTSITELNDLKIKQITTTKLVLIGKSFYVEEVMEYKLTKVGQ